MIKYTILIVEDHELIRFGLKTAFETKDFVSDIFEAQNAEEAINIVKNHKIDAVIMDLGLPTKDGIQATKEIKDFSSTIKILILTSHNNKDEVLESIKAGANGYCSKDVNPERLTDIVLSIIEGAAYFDPKVAEFILNVTCKNQISQKEIAENYNLTSREKEVLTLIQQGLNNTEISKKLELSINTIKVYVSNIIQKLGVEDRTQVAIKTLNNKIT